METELLATKLQIPPRTGDLVPGERLLQRFDRSLKHKLALISVPAGRRASTDHLVTVISVGRVERAGIDEQVDERKR